MELARLVTDIEATNRAKAMNQNLWNDIDEVGLGTLNPDASKSKEESKQALLSLDVPDKSEHYNANSDNVELIPIEDLEESKTGREKPIFNPKATIQNDSFEGRPNFNALSPEGIDDNEADDVAQQ